MAFDSLSWKRAGHALEKGNQAVNKADELENTVRGSGATEDRPSNPTTGAMYFDTTEGKPIWFDGTDWVDATGSTI